MPLQSETIAVPVVKGIDINTEARLVQPPGLLEATNSRFTRAGGATKRRGHVVTPVLGSVASPPGVAVPSGTDGWVFGFGYAKSGIGGSLIGSNNTDTAVNPDFPNNKYLYGVAQRDTESLLWNGHLLHSYSPQTGVTRQVASDAIMPTLAAAPIAKTQTGQLYPDFADTGSIRVVTWMDVTGIAYYAVYDSVTMAPIVTPRTLTSGGATYTTCFAMRVVALGQFVHIVLSDSSNLTLQLLTINQTNPSAQLVQRSLGACNSHFDVWKVDETLALIAKSDSPAIDLYWLSATGDPSATFPAAFIDMSVGNITLVGCAYDGNTGQVSLAFLQPTTPTVYLAEITASTGAYVAANVVQTGVAETTLRLSVTPKYFNSGSKSVVDVFWETSQVISGTTVSTVYKRRCNLHTGPLSAAIFKFHQCLASRAFTVGNRTFIWTGHNSLLQATWFLLDENLNPVGHQDFGVAAVPTPTTTSFLASVNHLGAGTTLLISSTPTEAVTTFHLALGFRIRVPSTSSTTGIFSEPSIKFTTLNFLPKLRATQGGRCTYFAGAQVWSYDGVELTEAGFHIGPELATPVVSVGGGLSNPGTYSYRVDLCYKNAQNEEIRSLSILTPSVSTTAPNKTITLTIPSCLTRRTNSYFLIYRNAVVAGTPLTNWWLLNSRDPSSASFYPNDQTTAFRTVVDDGTVTDTAIQNFELHPATSGDTYLQPVAPPACEIISSGHDRLWVAGGELAAGVIAPSRLFGPGEAPTFNPYLNIQVDRGFEAITAIGFVGNLKVFFRNNNAYVLDGDGPDNVSNGLWGTPQLALSDIGATSQDSLALITPGLLFQSAAGIRMMSASGNISPVGVPVDPVAKAVVVRGAVVANHDQEVRWYCEDRVIVYNYLYDAWSSWNFGAVGATRLPSGLAAVARADGNLWVETEGVYTDGPNNYTHRIRFPWMHAGNLGDFQRVRLIQGMGKFGDSLPHNVHVDLYYDERTFAEESFDWVMPDTSSSNVDTWGASTWGAGVWGDTAAVASQMSDSTWEWVRKPNRQKCSVFSVAIDDNNTAGAGFVLTALGLLLAKKEGLNRVPERGGTSNTRGGQ